MTAALRVCRAGPGLSLQDLGRPGYLAYGLSHGGAADRLAIAEGAALLGQGTDCAALEMAGMGGEFEALGNLVIALTGAPMPASIDGDKIAWNASHSLKCGSKLTIGAATTGVYGYLHVEGGFEATPLLGSRSTQLTAGLGRLIAAGDELDQISRTGKPVAGMTFDAEKRFGGGEVRVVASLQTGVFSPAEVQRFQNTSFIRDTRGNRMGARFLPDGDGFHADIGLTILSEVIVPGDIQITGDGTPFVLLSECQTTGGYPRIASVIPSDLPRVVQTRPEEQLRFRFVELDEAVSIEAREAARRSALRRTLRPLIRDPHGIADLLSYQLISGVTAGDELED